MQICGFLEKKLASVVKIAFSVAKEYFFDKNKTFLFKKNIISFGFCDCFSYSCQQCYGRLAKISLCMFRRTIWRISFLESLSFFLRFLISSKIFRSLTRNFWQGCHNCILRVQMKIFFNFWRKEMREIFFPEKIALLSFSDFEHRRSSVLLQALLLQACQKLDVHVQTNIFTDRVFGKLIIFSSFSGIPAKSFQSFDENVLTGWSQLRSTCTDVQKHNFRENIFLSKNW